MVLYCIRSVDQSYKKEIKVAHNKEKYVKKIYNKDEERKII